jgi:outer membrane murein-binding lipoprotein Lpp
MTRNPNSPATFDELESAVVDLHTRIDELESKLDNRLSALQDDISNLQHLLREFAATGHYPR